MQIKECILIEPYTCEEGDTVIEVSRKLRQTTLRHIFVVDKEMRPVGIISVIDINNRVVAEGKDAKVLKAGDIMTSPVDIVQFTDDVELVTKAMLDKKRSMNPVVRDNKMVGIITINELARHAKVQE